LTSLPLPYTFDSLVTHATMWMSQADLGAKQTMAPRCPKFVWMLTICLQCSPIPSSYSWEALRGWEGREKRQGLPPSGQPRCAYGECVL